MGNQNKHRMIVKVFAYTFIASLLLLPFRLQVFANSKTTLDSLASIALYSEQAYIYNLETETAIYQKNSDEKTSPASLTKLMTALVVRDYISDSELNQTVTITREMLTGLQEAQATVNGLQENDVVTISDLLKGMLIQSGADSSNALATYIESVTGESFVSLMNLKVNELALQNTRFANAHGLDDENQYSTPADMSIIGREFMKDTLLTEIMSTYIGEMHLKGPHVRSIPFRGSFIVMNPESNMYAPEVVWGKTGYTKDAQRCVLAYLNHNGMSFLVVLMKAPIPLIQNHHATNHDVKTLTNTLFDDYKIIDYQTNEQLAITRPLKHSKNINSIQLKLSRPSRIFVSKELQEDSISLNYHVPEEIIAPVEDNQQLGWVSFIVNDKELASIPIVSAHDYESIFDDSVISDLQLLLNRYWPAMLLLLLFFQVYINQRQSKVKVIARRRRAFAHYYNKSKLHE